MRRGDREVRVTAIVVARKNARHSFNTAERCNEMAIFWAERAEHHRDAADRWADLAIAGAKLLAADLAEPRPKMRLVGASGDSTTPGEATTRDHAEQKTA